MQNDPTSGNVPVILLSQYKAPQFTVFEQVPRL